MEKEKVHDLVRKRYGKTAREAQAQDSQSEGCCTPQPPAPSCCGPVTPPSSCCDAAGGGPGLDQLLGYDAKAMKAIPADANLGLGCGNPGAIAALKEGETVLDLGSGAGIDCFLSARQVGATGRVIGVDMTDDMLALARKNAAGGNFTNVEFRKGQIEKLPVGDGEVDVIISNCVVNLSPDKPSVYREAFRVLKPGGRLAISDIVATAELPPEVRADERLLTGCVAGAETIANQEAWLTRAGFENIRISTRDLSGELLKEWAPGSRLADYVVSATIEAVKPKRI